MTDFKQDGPMDVYPHRMAAAHARKARKIGGGNESKGVRIAIEKFEMQEPDILPPGGIERRRPKSK